MGDLNQHSFEYTYIFKSISQDPFFGNEDKYDKFFRRFNNTCTEISTSIYLFFYELNLK